MRRLSLSIYFLFAGLASGLAIYFWHVWSDNAYLLLYFFSFGLILIGAVLALQSLRGLLGWSPVKVAAVLAVSFVLSIGVVKVSGLDNALAGQFLISGNGSQSPCLAQFRSEGRLRPVREDAELFRPATLSAEQIAQSDLSGLRGGLAQVLIPGVTGLSLVLVVLSLRWRREVLRAKLAGDSAALILISYIYLRGPSAWCGQVFGLDILAVAILIGILLTKPLPKIFSR